jgi:hypothetical protein
MTNDMEIFKKSYHKICTNDPQYLAWASLLLWTSKFTIFANSIAMSIIVLLTSSASDLYSME